MHVQSEMLILLYKNRNDLYRLLLHFFKTQFKIKYFMWVFFVSCFVVKNHSVYQKNQHRLSTGSRENTVPSRVSPIWNPSCRNNKREIKPKLWAQNKPRSQGWLRWLKPLLLLIYSLQAIQDVGFFNKTLRRFLEENVVLGDKMQVNGNHKAYHGK